MKKQIITSFLTSALFIVTSVNAQNNQNNFDSTSTRTVKSDSVSTKTTTTTTTAAPVQAPAPVVAAAPDATPSDNKSAGYPKFYLGGRFMTTFSKFEVKTVDNGVAKTSFIVGYGVGGYMGYNFTKHVGLQFEVMYSAISQKYTENNIERRVDLSYLNLPLLLTLNTDVSKPVNLNVCFGPQVGINLGSKVKANGSNGVDTVAAVIALKPMDIGVAYGAGLDFRLSPSLTLAIGFRGVYGVLDISDNSKTKTTNSYYVLDRSHVKTYSGYLGLAVNF